MSEQKTGSKRNANIELLRIISMLMVTILHALGKSNLLGSLIVDPSVNSYAAWILESLSISAVNIFMLISGYFLIKSTFRISRLIELIAQVIFYTFGSFIVCYCLGIVGSENVDLYWFLNYLLPVHMEVFWFMTAYILIYSLLPIISEGIRHIEKKSFQTAIVILLIYECAFKSFLPFRTASDTRGYSFLWCLIVFLIGAYLRLYGFSFLKTPAKGLAVFFLSSAAVFAETMVLQYANSVMDKLKGIAGMSLDYNNFFVLSAAVGIFSTFIHLKPMAPQIGKVICFLSPMTLGVYLFQENLTLRFRWQPWFNLPSASSYPLFLFLAKVLGATIIMFVIGTVIDFLRIQLFKLPALIFKKK